VANIAITAVQLDLTNDSRFASVSWTATAGTAPGLYGTTAITNFSTNNVLWVKVVSEDLSTTKYYKFTLYPSPPSDGAFTDTDTTPNEIGGNITWTCLNPPAGISGYHIYWGSGPDTILTGWESTPRYTITDAFTGTQAVPANTAPPSGAKYFLIYSYNSVGTDYPICLAVPIVDVSFSNTYGAFTVTGINGATTAGLSYTSPTLTIPGSGAGAYLIKGTGSATTDRVKVNSGVTTTIILENVNINVSGTSEAIAFDMTGATVNLTLKETNVLKSGANRAGLLVPYGSPNNSILTISEDSTGSLAVTGGNYGAGIGGNSGQTSGSITIEGGAITATGGGDAGAGIGGGGNSSGQGGAGGTVTISGGTVTASGDEGACIGGGYGYTTGGAGGTITISGGTVTASGD
jgi:hypothetical protein